jgi:hypothetical protein
MTGDEYWAGREWERLRFGEDWLLEDEEDENEDTHSGDLIGGEYWCFRFVSPQIRNGLMREYGGRGK